MEQSVSLAELLELILYMGFFTFLLGALMQGYVLFRRRVSFLKSAIIILLTRLVSIGIAFFFWMYWPFKFDVMFSFLLLPALVPELVLSPLLLGILSKSSNKI